MGFLQNIPLGIRVVAMLLLRFSPQMTRFKGRNVISNAWDLVCICESVCELAILAQYDAFCISVSVCSFIPLLFAVARVSAGVAFTI